MPENLDMSPLFVSAEDNKNSIDKEISTEPTEDKKKISFVVSYEIDPLPQKEYVLPDKRLFPDSVSLIRTGHYNSLEKALIFYSTAPEGGKKKLKLRWNNNDEPKKHFDFENCIEYDILTGENGFSELHDVPEDVLNQNKDGAFKMLQSNDFKDIYNRLKHYIEKEEMRIPKVFFIGVEETKNNEAYVQTAIVGNNIECKFYDNNLIYQRRDMVPFANTNADLFKATLLSYIADKVEAYGNPLKAVDYNKFNEIAKEANQLDSYRKLFIDEDLLNRLKYDGWSVNVVSTDFFYDVEFTKKDTKANVEFFMSEGDSLNNKVQETVQGRLNAELPFSEEVNNSYRETFQELSDIVRKWDTRRKRKKSINTKIKSYNTTKTQNETPQKGKKDSRSL